MQQLPQLIAFGLAGVAGTALLTPLVRWFARTTGTVAYPRSDRWHAAPTAMLGGIAIFFGAIVPLLLMREQRREDWIVLASSAAMFVFGLLDDYLEFKPYQKLIAQFCAAAVVIYFGLILPWTSSQVVNIGITFAWLVGITNAVNLLDNMDGLAAGISAVAAIFLAINFYQNQQLAEALALTAFAGALAGFLIYNHNPASIFMGDCGSMFIGFFLASTALLSGTGGFRSRSIVSVLAVPVLVLFVPIFDTTFVAVMRKLAGRNPMKGGRDHTSHRLVALGLTEKHAVWMLYALAISSGVLGLLVRHMSMDVSVASILAFIVVLTFVGVQLGHVRVYSEDEVAAAREKPLVALLFDLSYKKRVFEVALDTVLIALAYYTAYALRFGTITQSPDWDLFLRSLPVIICLKLATFLALGMYRGFWRYVSVTDALHFAKAVAFGSVVSILTVVFVFKFSGFSRTVFVLDACLLFLMVVMSRFGFRFMRGVVSVMRSGSAKRVLIYGAGDGGELVLRELRSNHVLNVVPVAFVDDDPTKKNRVIHGLRVYGSGVEIDSLCRQLDVSEVILSTSKISSERLILIVGACAASGIVVRRAEMKFETVSGADLGWVIPAKSEDMQTPVPLIATHGETNIVHPTARTTATDH